MYLTLALLALTATMTGLSDSELAAVQRGEMVTRAETLTRPGGKAAGQGMGAMLVERSPAQVWATLARFEDKAEYMPRLKSIAVLERRPGQLRVHMEVDASVTTARYTVWFTLDEATWHISWKIDPSAANNSITDTEGEYHLYQVAPERTLVVYRSYVDSGLRVPRFIQSYMTRRSIPNLLKAIKQRVESGGVWRK